MAIDLPDYEEIVERIRADVKGLLATLDPTIYGSLIRTITDSNAGRHYDNVLSIAQLEKELFPDTATRENLERWAAYEGLTPFSEESSSGGAVITGTVGTNVYSGKEYQTSVGNIYSVDVDTSISAKVISITSLTRSGTTVTAITSEAHQLATNISAIIAGANETDYNGTFSLIVIDSVTFSYEIIGTPITPATGTITVSCDCALVAMTSDDTGIDQNLGSGAELTEVSTDTGIDPIGYVDYAGFTGGQNEETSENLYTRTIQSRSNPVANFNSSAIEKQARLISGVTRVLVKRITPDIGQVTILFVRDDDDNIIPDSSEVLEVKNSILEILPATDDEDDVIVTAPTPVLTDYTFSLISPSTTSMAAAIEANILAFYQDVVAFETDITEESYKNAIIGTIDTATGDRLFDFTLIEPIGDITVGDDSIGVPGTITI